MAEEKAAQTTENGASSFPLKVIMGQKVGMTQIFSDAGETIPVSVIFTGTCVTTDIRTPERDGYSAIQMGLGARKEKSSTKSYIEQFKKKNLTPSRWLKEFRVSDSSKFQVGQKVPLDIFSPGDYVDVSGISKGHGFAGVMKRHNFRGLPASHGASDKERSRGSSGGGSGQPQRVLKGTRMAGRMGSEWVTMQSLEIVRVDKENDLILVKGAVPGVSQQIVVIQETTKALKHKRAAVVKASKKAAKKPEKPAPKK